MLANNGVTLPPPGLPRVLITKISPPLYINSRKLAKESSSKKYNTVIDPFDLSAVEQDLFIRSAKILRANQAVPSNADSSAPQSVNEEKITSDIFGLMNYFSAPNIRNKIRHPLFLALKFPEAVKLFFNQSNLEEQDARSLAGRLHRELQNEFSCANQEMNRVDQFAYNNDGFRGIKFICYINIEDARGKLTRN